MRIKESSEDTQKNDFFVNDNLDSELLLVKSIAQYSPT